jgi:hypothetical protein
VHAACHPARRSSSGRPTSRTRVAPNVSAERQQGLQARFGDQYRLYLTQMGVRTDIVDMIDENSQTGRTT